MADAFDAIDRLLFYAQRLKATLDYLAKEKDSNQILIAEVNRIGKEGSSYLAPESTLAMYARRSRTRRE